MNISKHFNDIVINGIKYDDSCDITSPSHISMKTIPDNEINDAMERNYEISKHKRMNYMLLTIITNEKYNYNNLFNPEKCIFTVPLKYSDEGIKLSNKALDEFIMTPQLYTFPFDLDTGKKLIKKIRVINNESMTRKFKKEKILKEISIEKLENFIEILNQYELNNDTNIANFSIYDNILYEYICNNHINDKKIESLGGCDIVMLKYMSKCYIEQLNMEKVLNHSIILGLTSFSSILFYVFWKKD